MKKVYGSVLTAMIFLASIAACQKGGSGGGGECSETAMTITTSPAINSTEAPSAGETFPLTVNITANLPNAGATIAVKARPESSQTAFYTETKTTTAGVNSFTITGTPVGTPCIVEITVTSKSCATNTFSGLYRYSRK
ncbi:MAG: hypothetical protein EOO02_18100 [Chitinophagaceae bacterium]|nr:MAG: hypothetical protein EOO02_18100 [Chitinophagaceae bacterium]